MFSKSVCVALLGLSLSAFMTEASPILGGGKNEDCAPPKTIIKTVTVTARAATNTGKASTGASTGNSGSSKGSTGNTGATKGSTSSSSGSKGTTSSSTGSKGTTSSSTGSKGTTSSSTGSKGTTSTGSKGTTSSSTGSKGTTSSSNTGSKGTTGSTGSKGTTTTAKGSTSTTISKGNQAVNAGAAGSGANNAGSGAAGGDPQTSLTLDPRVIATGFKNNGQAVPTAGQVASLTSGNNFINFCLTVPNFPITNGKQIVTGSCNPSPIGVIPNVDTMPSSKFTFPTNFGTVKANTLFTAKMAVNNLITGNFVNAQENYFAAPQQLDKNGVIIGHTHFVIEQLTAIDQTTPTDPGTFIFFKGINGAAVGGVVSTDVTDGVPEGVFRMCSINSAANHQPVIVPVAQHGWLDDCSYFFATADGNPPAGVGAASGAAANSTAAAGAAASASAATGKLNVSASAVASASAVPVSKGAVASASAAPVGKGAAAASSAAPVGKGAAAASSAVATAKGTAATAAATNKAAQGSTGGKGLGDTVLGGFNPLANPAAAKSSAAAVKGAATPAAAAAKGAATPTAAAAKGAATSAAAAAKGAASAADASSKDAAKGTAAGAAASKSQAIKSDKGAKN